MKFKKIIRTVLIILLMSGYNFQAIYATTNNDSLESSVKKFANINKKYRIAISDFKNTSGKMTKYDIYIADSLIHQLSNYKNFRLVERTKLKTVLKELELSNTGIISSDQALKIGGVLPVDIIGTGSYTIIGSKVNVNVRFISVVTGEIVYTLAYSFKKDLSKISENNKESIDFCEKDKNELLDSLKDLDGEKNINNAVEKALVIPFDNKCGQVHLSVIKIFRKYNIYPKKYKEFLINTLLKIEEPSKDKRAGRILRYFQSDGVIDEDEWKSGLQIVMKSYERFTDLYLKLIINSKNDKYDLFQKRVKELIELVREKKIGRPVRLNFNQFFIILSSAVSNYGVYDNKNDKLLYVFKNYVFKLKDEQKVNRYVLRKLSKMYSSEKKIEKRRMLLNMLIKFINKKEKNRNIAVELFNLASKIEQRIKRNKDIVSYQEELKLYNKELGGWVCFLKDNAKYSSLERRVLKYIKKYKLECKD